MNAFNEITSRELDNAQSFKQVVEMINDPDNCIEKNEDYPFDFPAYQLAGQWAEDSANGYSTGSPGRALTFRYEIEANLECLLKNGGVFDDDKALAWALKIHARRVAEDC